MVRCMKTLIDFDCFLAYIPPAVLHGVQLLSDAFVVGT